MQINHKENNEVPSGGFLSLILGFNYLPDSRTQHTETTSDVRLFPKQQELCMILMY